MTETTYTVEVWSYGTLVKTYSKVTKYRNYENVVEITKSDEKEVILRGFQVLIMED